MKMEEKKEVQTATEQAKDSKKKDAKKDKKKSSFLAEHKAEFKKITWPTRKEVGKETVTVIVISLLVGAIIFGMDTLLKLGYNALTGLNGSTVSTTDGSDQIEYNIDADGFDYEVVTEDATAEAEEAEAGEEVATEVITDAEVVATTVAE